MGTLSEFRVGGVDWLPPHLPASFPAVYNAWDYAEGRSRPSGRLAVCTYKRAIEMCSHSKSQGRQAGGRAGGSEEPLHLQLLGDQKGGQRLALIYSGSVQLQERGEKQWDFWLQALLCILSCINLHTEFKVVK